ncbi:DUF6763 family protein [Alkalilimnicola sp. S0819]|uniref:DUF6763 family protein n=1 Tax=Alkalilimnicola sp. S0819 TaxID=2613922 RepID=UPI0012618C5F|nr:DUF6763 family protein [Alkalilimnicola sp. S0819]KAB7623365.1 hypothetical protein F3N43_09680 [Alkalilimnicola sp. S0819]MPQ16905.1 hypothetical protein [Alkalilimnicola sp. S0819]
MAVQYRPIIGDWYLTAEGDSFEVVAYDPEDGTIEIQYFDGAVEELDLETWWELPMIPSEPPEDWSGSMDISAEDYGVDLERASPQAMQNPLDDMEF